MAFYPVDGESLYTVNTVQIYTVQGTAITVSGSATTVSGVPSIQLLPTLNPTVGYYNGQMLARAAGDGTGIYAGLTAGALINFDPASDDTGQKVWCGFIICDEDLKFALPVGETYPGTLRCAVAHGGWKIRQQFLYAGSTPAADATVVQTAVAAWPTVQQFTASNPAYDGAVEVEFTY